MLVVLGEKIIFVHFFSTIGIRNCVRRMNRIPVRVFRPHRGHNSFSARHIRDVSLSPDIQDLSETRVQLFEVFISYLVFLLVKLRVVKSVVKSFRLFFFRYQALNIKAD